MTDEPLIRVTEDGPYRVTGVLRLTRRRIVRDETGVPRDWDEGIELERRPRFLLCRCGSSSTKPFCDATHETIGFDGTEVADHGRGDERRKPYAGAGIVMTDDRALCSHAGFCTRRDHDAWDMVAATGDTAVRADLIGIVRRCPSGALEYTIPPSDEPVEAEARPEIAVAADGPLWVRGRIRIESADGELYAIRDRVALCRCGRSMNKPFCDGTHRDIGFRDA